jgi:hypothetical protein
MRAAGLAGVALAAVVLVGGFMALQAMFPAKVAVSVATPADGSTFGADAQDSRFTLSVRRPVQLTVFAGKETLWERQMQPGELYRAPNVADLAVTAADAGAVEVMFDGKSIGFVGKDRAAARQVPLRRLLASAVGPLVTTDNKAKPAKPAPARAPARSPAPTPPAVVFAPPPPPVPAAPRIVEPIPAPPAPAAIATITEPPPSTVPQPQPSATAVSTSVVQSIIEIQAATAKPVAQPQPVAVVSERERVKATADVAKAVKDLEKQRAEARRRANNAMRNGVYGLPH